MKMYVVCELNDENYTDASYSFFYTYNSAKEKAIIDCVEHYEGNCEVETQDNGFRIISSDENVSFYVTEIKQIDSFQGRYLLIWHHGYEGVDFEVRFQGTYDECKAKMKKDMDNTIEEYECLPEDVCHNVIDTGNEWEVWDIVEII